MLQQTQVSRVMEKYKELLKKFPTVQELAKAPLSAVLKEWSGLGYNRRGKYLHDAARMIVEEHRGKFKEALKYPLPGVGPYTRAAVGIFAFNEPDTLIETNIRAAFIYHFFTDARISTGRQKYVRSEMVKDRDILTIARKAAEGQDPREWHWALMDYGAYLKRSGVRNNTLSAHYTKQSKFEGSVRQLRGVVLRDLRHGPLSHVALRRRLEASPLYTAKALEGLAKDGLIKKEKGNWRIA